jgi:quercetin dioxygenase-like cupin family protein
MKITVKHADSVEAVPVQMEGAENVSLRMLVGESEGAPTFLMRQFDVAPGGHTPLHRHPWEHECYILAGRGVLHTGEEDRPFQAGDCLFIAGRELHQFHNTADELLQFLCLVPKTSGEKSCRLDLDIDARA